MFAEWISNGAALWWMLILPASLKVFVVLLVVECLARLSRHRSPAARHWIWALGVLACLALPVLAFLLPAWGLLPEWTAMTSWASANLAGEEWVSSASAGASLAHWSLLAPLIWGLGFSAVLARWLVGRMSLSLLHRVSRRIVDGPLRTKLDRSAARIGLRRDVLLLSSDRRTVPMTWGVIRPVLLLPADAERWGDERTSSVMLHELAHLRRGDCLWQIATRLTCAVYWFHPLIWRAAREMHVERESACDDLVLASGVRATSYAESLLNLSRTATRMSIERCSAVAMAGEGALLELRLLSILDHRRVRAEPGRPAVLLGALGLALLAAPLAMLCAGNHDGDGQSNVVEARTEALTGRKSMLNGSQSRVAIGLHIAKHRRSEQRLAGTAPSLLQLLEKAADGRPLPPVGSVELSADTALVAPGATPLRAESSDRVMLLDRRIATALNEDALLKQLKLAPRRQREEASIENMIRAWSAAAAAAETDTHSKTTRLDNAVVLDTKGPMAL